MLSIVDLIEAGTVSLDLAAYALAAIGSGASFMVGANPGGAGKTTVMGALLNFVPADIQLVPADSAATVQRGLQSPDPRRCYICHEIGSGHWYAYLWGQTLRDYFQLPAAGHLIATNLHADTLDQARRQVVIENRVPDNAFRRVNLVFFLAIRRGAGGALREIASVWESDGQSPHRQIFGRGQGDLAGAVHVARIGPAAERIEQLMVRGARTIQQVRAALLEINGRTHRPHNHPHRR